MQFFEEKRWHAYKNQLASKNGTACTNQVLSTIWWYCRLVRDHHLHKYLPPAADRTPQKRKTKNQIITALQKTSPGLKIYLKKKHIWG